MLSVMTITKGKLMGRCIKRRTIFLSVGGLLCFGVSRADIVMTSI